MNQPPSPIQQLLDATNAGDSEAFLATFAEDAVLIDFGRTVDGRTAISRWNSDENIGTSNQIRVTTSHHDSDITTVGITVSGNGYNGPGAFTFTTNNAQITRLDTTG